MTDTSYAWMNVVAAAEAADVAREAAARWPDVVVRVRPRRGRA